MLFQSLNFFVFFSIVALHYYRAPVCIRLISAATAVAYPLLVLGPVALSFWFSLLAGIGLGVTAFLRYTGSEIAAKKNLLLLASLIFYNTFLPSWSLLLLLLACIVHQSAFAICRVQTAIQKKLLLIIAIALTASFLCVFKYGNFAIDNINAAADFMGLQIRIGHSDFLDLFIPIGISFYTFKALSYLIDVYRGNCKPVDSFYDVALYLAFFPTLLAGPIHRAGNFFSEISKDIHFDTKRVKGGLLLIFAGMLKKICVADALNPIVDQAYINPEAFSGTALLIAALSYSFQIYCDFAGYSDIAIGCAKVLDINVPPNFNRPYFATNITDFWRRWHMSLSFWFRDYLYIPLGGGKKGKSRTVANLLLTMIVCGLWHGAAWTFIFWGLFHGILLAIHRLTLFAKGQSKPFADRDNFSWFFRSISTFFLVTVGWIFFRAETIQKAGKVLYRIATGADGLMVPYLFPLVLIPLFLITEAIQAKTSLIEVLIRHARLSRMIIYAGVVLMLLLVTTSNPVTFVYFAF